MSLRSNIPVDRLGKYCDKIGSGVTPRGGASVYIDSGASLIRSQNVYNLSFKTDGLAHIDDEIAKKMDGVTIESNDVLLNITGDSVARCCMVPDYALPARVNQHVSIIRPDSAKLDPKYLTYYFVSPYMQAYMLSLAGSGGTRKALTKSMIEDFVVPVPAIQEQRRIASILSAYDDMIENNRRRIHLLEEATRLLYQEWFVYLRFPGHEHVSVHDGVPEGWAVRPLADIADITMGQSPKSEFYNDDGDGLPFHQGVKDFGDRFVDHRTYCSVRNRIANPGDILCSVRAPVGRLNLTLDEIVIGRGLSAIRSRLGHQSFLYYQLNNHFVKEDMIGTGAIFASVTKKDMRTQKLLQPTEDLIDRFESISWPMDEQIRCLHQQNTYLRLARNLLLPRLMNGEISP